MTDGQVFWITLVIILAAEYIVRAIKKGPKK